MIITLTTPLTHTTPIRNDKMTFCKFSMVKILHNAAVQEKKATRGGTFTFQIFFQGKVLREGGLKH
jgi:hypothetical protein